jgi:hypothetical protein
MEWVNFRLRRPSVLHWIISDQLAPFSRCEDRPQPSDHHVDRPRARPDRLGELLSSAAIRWLTSPSVMRAPASRSEAEQVILQQGAIVAVACRCEMPSMLIERRERELTNRLII